MDPSFFYLPNSMLINSKQIIQMLLVLTIMIIIALLDCKQVSFMVKQINYIASLDYLEIMVLMVIIIMVTFKINYFEIKE